MCAAWHFRTTRMRNGNREQHDQARPARWPTAAAMGDEVSPVELLFDLVFVFAISQLSHHLLDHLTPGEAPSRPVPS
jgi:low temperature requirement protein LtrA